MTPNVWLSFRARLVILSGAAKRRSRGSAGIPAETCVILSEAKDPQIPGRGLSVGTPKILRLTAQDDNRLTAQDDNRLTAQDDNRLTAQDDRAGRTQRA